MLSHILEHQFALRLHPTTSGPCIPCRMLASNPGLPSQLFSQPWKNTHFSKAAKIVARGGLGTRLVESPFKYIYLPELPYLSNSGAVFGCNLLDCWVLQYVWVFTGSVWVARFAQGGVGHHHNAWRWGRRRELGVSG